MFVVYGTAKNTPALRADLINGVVRFVSNDLYDTQLALVVSWLGQLRALLLLWADANEADAALGLKVTVSEDLVRSVRRRQLCPAFPSAH
jgi:hypothetical protein